MKDTELNAYGILILRLTLGLAMLAHGLVLKVMTFGMAGTVGFFVSLGLPAISAYATVAVEILGGLALIAGFQTRIAALIQVPVLLGAVWVHAGNGWVFSSPNGGWEFPLFWAAMLIVQALLGDGPHALKIGSQSRLKTA
jgi:putative oxidoreductase